MTIPKGPLRKAFTFQPFYVGKYKLLSQWGCTHRDLPTRLTQEEAAIPTPFPLFGELPVHPARFPMASVGIHRS